MPSGSKIYRFGNFAIDCSERRLLRHGLTVPLEQRLFHVLLLLVENAGRTVEKGEFFERVWPDTFVADNNLTNAITLVRKALGDKTKSPTFIETQPGRGYRFVAPVVIEEQSKIETTRSSEKGLVESGSNSSAWSWRNVRSISNHLSYVMCVSGIYGLLFWIALFLEIAYQFDRYGEGVLWAGVPIFLWIWGTSLLGLVWSERLAKKRHRFSLHIGLLSFIGGACVAYVAGAYFLPVEPITAADNIRTQPAYAAYFKNVFIYFLPLAVFFILIPFHHVSANNNPDIPDKQVSISIAPNVLLGILGLAIVYSLVSTFYLLDNLSSSPYHGLFTTLVFFRFFIYFGLSLLCLLWYRWALGQIGDFRSRQKVSDAISRPIFPLAK